jgi:Fe-S-cluster-containing dehydrogenase component
MARYGMLINIDKCNGCYNCFLSCRDEYEGNDYLPYSAAQGKEGKSWMRVTEIERGSTPKVKVDYIPVPCLQCSDATCLTSDGAVYRREDGIIIIDPEKSVGKKEIVSKCPHRVISWNEEKNIPQKCTFCAHLLDKGWKEPRCVESCPSGALVFGDLDNPDSEISKLIASSKNEELNPAFKLKSNVRYIDLPKRFIAGEVVLGDNFNECAPGIKVLLSDGKKTLERKTDNFGDFEFDGLEASKKYTIRVEYKGYKTAVQEVATYSDVNIGVIELIPEKKSGNKQVEKKVRKVSKKTIKKPAKAVNKKSVKKQVKTQVKKGKKTGK